MMVRPVTILAATLLGIGLPVLLPDPARAAPQRVCRIGDKRLTELSGLVATRTGYVVVNDGSDEPTHRKIFYLDQRCKVTRTVSYPSRPRDTEDLGLAADGTLWVADIGDNSLTRTTIAVWQLAPGSRTPRLFRMSYPDGPHDAEALLLTATGTPIVVTKTVAAASVYVPDAPLSAGRTTPLRRAGGVTVPVTDTSNPFSLPGRLVITGGAVSPDGHRATLRTYADAFEFDAPDGDLLRAVTSGRPRQIPLPDEPQGESVAYTPDGTALLTVSEEADGKPAELLRYPLPSRPATAAPSSPPTTSRPATPPATTPPAETVAHRARLPAGALVTGAILIAAAAVLAFVAFRRRR